MVDVFVKRPEDVLPLVKKWAGDRQENFIVITLNGAHSVIKVHHVTKGLVNRVIIHPREVFFPAIVDNAVAVLLAHNHPSGDVVASPEDKAISERLQDSADILGFHLLDHIIFSKNLSCWSSMRQDGWLK